MENKSLFDVIRFNKTFKKDLFILEYNFNYNIKIFTVFFHSYENSFIGYFNILILN